LRVVAEGAIAPYVTVTPPTFPAVFNRGQSVTFDVMVSVPADAPVGVSDGTLVLKRVIGKKVTEVWRAEALAVSVEVVWPTFLGGEELGFALQYPPGWYVSEDEDEDANTFHILKSGFDPPKLSAITIARTTNLNPELLPIAEWFALYPAVHPDSEPLEEEYLLLGGKEAVRIVVPFFFAEREHIYISDGPDIVQVVFSRWDGLVTDYDSIVQSISFYE
jgi:hypothetical protein